MARKKATAVDVVDEVAAIPSGETATVDNLLEQLEEVIRRRAEIEQQLTAAGRPLPEPVRNAQEADALLATLGRLQAEIDAIKEDVERRIAAIADPAETKLTALMADYDAIEARLERFAVEFRHTFAGKDRKSLKLPSGTLQFRLGTASFEVEDEEALLSHLAATQQKPVFVITSDKIDTGAFVKRPDIARKIPGGRYIDRQEKFAAVPDKRVSPAVEQSSAANPE